MEGKNINHLKGSSNGSLQINTRQGKQINTAENSPITQVLQENVNWQDSMRTFGNLMLLPGDSMQERLMFTVSEPFLVLPKGFPGSTVHHGHRPPRWRVCKSRESPFHSSRWSPNRSNKLEIENIEDRKGKKELCQKLPKGHGSGDI
ncbi:uncharacterized protein LOC144235957 [Crocuta crocuta]